MSKNWIAVLSLLAVACGGPRAGSDPRRAVTPLTLEPPPIYSLLGFRADLQLESDQIARLDSLANWIRAENEPVVDSLRATSEAGQNRAVLMVDDTTNVYLQRIRANNRRVGEAVGEVLTAEQRATACRLYDREPRGGARRGREAERQRERRGDQAPADSARTPAGRVWPWCGTGGAPADSAA